MHAQSGPAKSGTRRMLAVAAIMCLIVVLAVFMRRDDGAVVMASASEAAPARASVTAPNEYHPIGVERDDTPRVAGQVTLTPIPNSKPPGPPPIFIRVTAEMEGGCALPPDTQVAFLQLMPEGTPPFAEHRPLAELAGESGGYEVAWQTGAIALSVVVESSVGAVPGVTLDRKDIEGLKGGAYHPDKIRAQEFSDPISALSLGTRAARHLLYGTDISQKRIDAEQPREERTIVLSFLGSCASSVVLELPPGVNHSLIDGIDAYWFVVHETPRGYIGQLPPDHSLRLFSDGTRGRLAFEETPGEIRIHPLFEGTYRFSLKTSDSRRWSSGDVILSLGEERRLKVELTESARITARVVGASNPDAQITYRLTGIENPAGFFPLDRMKEDYDPRDAYNHDLRRVVRADQPGEFVALSAGAYTVYARESESLRGNASVVLRADEHGEVLIELGPGVPVTVEVVDAKGKPAAGPEYTLWGVPWRSGSRGWRTPLDSEGRYKETFVPGPYTLTVRNSDTTEESTIFARVVGPGDGDHYRIHMNGKAKIQGRILDANGKPISGAHVRAESTHGYGWGNPETRAVSDAQGAFELIVPGGPVDVQAAHQIFVKTVRVDAPLPEGEILEIKFESLKLHGVVLDWNTREPVPNHTYSVSYFGSADYVGEAIQEPKRASLSWRGRTDAQGEFESNNMPAGFYALSASEDRLGGGEVMVELKSSDQPRIELFTSEEGGALEGYIVDNEGRPVPKMQLQNLYRGGSIPTPIVVEVLTDFEGHYKVTGTLLGEDITAIFVQSGADIQPRFFLAHIAEGLSLREGEVTTYNFTAIGAARLMVNVMTAAGVPLRGATVRLMQNGEQVFDQARLVPGPTVTNLNGQRFFRAIPAGEYQIEVTTPEGTKGSANVALAEHESKMIEIRPE